MCLIIHNPDGKTIPHDIIDNALCINPDGFGIFYHDSGETILTMDQAYAEVLLDSKRAYTAHFRYATSGSVGLKNCHPFRIDDTYSLMMNGTIERLVSKKSVDTEELCKILKGLTEPKMLAVLRTHSCRFVLLNRKTGGATVVNSDMWSKHKGVLYSKDNCFNPYNSWLGKYKPAKVGSVAPPYTPNYVDDWCVIDDEDPVTWPCVDDWCDPIPEPDTGKLTTVAVYGTLKSGFGNHKLLAEAEFVGVGVTQMAYPMIASGIPFVIDQAGTGNQIHVEVYRVTSAELDALDRLEGDPNWYVRREKGVKLKGGAGMTAWIYVIPPAKCKSLTGMDWRKEPWLAEYVG